MRIELTSGAWKALILPLNYTCSNQLTRLIIANLFLKFKLSMQKNIKKYKKLLILAKKHHFMGVFLLI